MECMEDPHIRVNCHVVDNPVRLTLMGEAISRVPLPIPGSGFATSAFPPSAAIVTAFTQISRAPSGKASKSLRAGLIQETGRVGLVMLTAHDGRCHICQRVSIMATDQLLARRYLSQKACPQAQKPRRSSKMLRRTLTSRSCIGAAGESDVGGEQR